MYVPFPELMIKSKNTLTSRFERRNLYEIWDCVPKKCWILKLQLPGTTNKVSLSLKVSWYFHSPKNKSCSKIPKEKNKSLHRLIEFMGKTFQAAQLTQERFLTIDHSCKIFFWYLPNWTSTNLWCVVLYVTYSTTHQRSMEAQFGRYQKIFCRSDLWSKISQVLIVQLVTFPP